MHVAFEGHEGGSWRVVARVSDEEDRPNETELRVWVAGGRLPPRRDLEQEEVTLVPDRKEYGAGDVARVLVLAPFAPAEGLLTLRRSGLLREERFSMTEASHTLEIPLEEAWTPNVHVQVDLVGSAPRDEAPGAPRRPAFASGALDLAMPPDARRLGVEVEPREPALAPGGKTVLDLTLRDAEGRARARGRGGGGRGRRGGARPHRAIACRIPLDIFYAQRGSGVSDEHLRSHVQLADPGDLEDLMERPGEVRALGVRRAMMAMDAAPRPWRQCPASETMPEPQAGRAPARSVCAPTSPPSRCSSRPWSPTTSGRAEVPVTLPDNLTRYRVMVVAAEGGQRFGKGESTLTARLPLMVRPSPPRFLNFGDRFELPVVVQNQTDEAMTVDVARRAPQTPQLARRAPGAGWRCRPTTASRCASRPPRRRPAPRASRSARVAGSVADAAELDAAGVDAGHHRGLRHLRRRSTRAPSPQPVAAPGRRGARSSAAWRSPPPRPRCRRSPTPSSTCVAYPFECAEQLASRILAVAALRDVLTAFEAEGLPSPDELSGGGGPGPRAAAAAAERRRRLRLLAPRRRSSWPYSQHPRGPRAGRGRGRRASRCPTRCVGALPGVPAQAIESHIPAGTTRQRPAAPSWPTRSTCGTAWAMPRPERARAAGPARPGLDGLSLEAVGWLLPVLSGDPRPRRERGRRSAGTWPTGVTETAGAAHFAAAYGDGAHLLLHSDRRADGVLLEALIDDQPRERPDPQARARPARAPHGRAAGRTPRRTPSCCWRWTATSRPTRRPTPGLRGPGLAGRALRRRARVPGPHHRAPPRRDPHALRCAQRDGDPTCSSPRTGPGGSTTGSGCATRPRT